MRPDGRQRDDLPGQETVERRYAPRYPLWVDSPVERPPLGDFTPCLPLAELRLSRRSRNGRGCVKTL
jgi:hypothetical protein